MGTWFLLLIGCWLSDSKPAELSIEAKQQDDAVWLRMTDGELDYAHGLIRYELQCADGQPGNLKARVITAEGRRVTIQASDARIELVHEISPRTGGGFVESIKLRNTTNQPLKIEDYRFGLKRNHGAAGELRAVAVPFRRQADGKLHDWSLAQIQAGEAVNSDWHNDPAVIAPVPHDTARGRLRSEAWALTDGRGGLLVAKYNADDIEYSMLDGQAGEQGGVTLGGSSFALHREPESMHSLPPGEWVRLGETHYVGFTGDWSAGYQFFRHLLDEWGHGLTADYNPPVNWNELFDVGWYHSEPNALRQHWTLEALLNEARKAKEVGADLLYLDPGWEVCEGTSLWAEDRLGSVADLAQRLRKDFGLALGFRTIGRVYRDEFPRDWYIQHGPEAKPYERPSLVPVATAEPVPATDTNGLRNLALLPQARARASSTIPGYDIHKQEHLNDGWYSNRACWISNGEPSWAEIDLGAAYEIGRICLGNEHTVHHNDRTALHFRVLVATEKLEASDDPRWTMVAENRNKPLHSTLCFDFSPRKARYVRVAISESLAGQARLDEIEIYESKAHPWDVTPRKSELAAPPAPSPINFWEVCTLNPRWQEEKVKRLNRIVPQGMSFAMFDEYDWRGPCYSQNHGHSVPSTPEGHARAVFGLIREVKKLAPELLVEAHDPVWPWGMRYLPVYWGQTLDPAKRPGFYEENWGFEFMWNPIDDLISGRALCLYYYALGCSIPLYDHITMENDNDQALAFWWYASTVRHLGIGGKKGLTGKAENETRWKVYCQAMKRYNRLRPWFVKGDLAGVDELNHLHTLPNRKGGVLVAFNLTEKSSERTLKLDPSLMDLTPGGVVPSITDAQAAWSSDHLEVRYTVPPMSPLIMEIAVDAGERVSSQR